MHAARVAPEKTDFRPVLLRAPHAGSSPEKMMDIFDRFLAELRAAGVDVPNNREGIPDIYLALERVADTPAEQALARVLCKFVLTREWKEAGGDDFYKSRIWLQARYRALAKHGNRCQCCGAGAKDGAVLQVDHIKPKSKHPELALSIDNMQVLCRDCNLGKSNRDDTDWR